jgi:hypothetical protein
MQPDTSDVRLLAFFTLNLHIFPLTILSLTILPLIIDHPAPRIAGYQGFFWFRNNISDTVINHFVNKAGEIDGEDS